MHPTTPDHPAANGAPLAVEPLTDFSREHARAASSVDMIDLLNNDQLDLMEQYARRAIK